MQLVETERERRPASAEAVLTRLDVLVEPGSTAPIQRAGATRWPVLAMLAVLPLVLAGILLLARNRFGGQSPTRTAEQGASEEGQRSPGPVSSVRIDPFAEHVRGLTAIDQVKAVIEELRKRNPGFDGKHESVIGGGRVLGLSFSTFGVKDIRPLAALAFLEQLKCQGSHMAEGLVLDLEPLRGMPLKDVDVSFNKAIRDLRPLQGMPLESFVCYGCQVVDLRPLQGMKLSRLSVGGCDQEVDLAPLRAMPLTYLNLNNTSCRSLKPLEGMPLETLRIAVTQVGDLSPLKGMSIRELNCELTPIRDLSVLKGLPKLTSLTCTPKNAQDLQVLRELKLVHLNNQRIADFWKQVDAKKQ